ncbi:MAG: hypothetical protein H7Y89_06230 [Steroidobacteraceae bacterium]|nr:hypothetical protein [Steroidobacteraceae bacterium]
MPHLKTLVRVLVVTAACAAPLAACAAETPGKPKRVGVAPPTRIPDVVQTPGVPPGNAVTLAELPRELRRVVVADAARRLGVAESGVVLTRAERVTWNDGALGCPQPGMGYLQAIVPGYRVVARTAERELIYHTDESHGAIACEQTLPRNAPKDPAKPPPADDSQPRTDPPPKRMPDR